MVKPVKVGPLLKTSFPPPALPVASEIFAASCAEVVEAKSPRVFDVVANKPVVGRVTLVVPVVLRVREYKPEVAKASAKVTFLLGAIVSVSVPSLNTIELVFSVVLAFTVRALLFAMVNVALVAGAVMVTLLTEVAVIAPTVVILVVPAQVERAVFSTLLRASMVLAAVASSTSGEPVPAVCLPNKDAVAMFAILDRVTAPGDIVAVMPVVPLPVTSPLRVMVWSPVLDPDIEAAPPTVRVLAPRFNVPVPAVKKLPLIEVAVAAPKAGAIRVGPLLKTR
jgi:hypothetical protein